MNIKVLVSKNVIGAIQSLSLVESPHIADELVSQKLTATRMRFNKLQLEELFSRGFVHVKAQQYPMQIVVEDDQQQEILKLHNVWITGMTYTFTSNDWIIAEGIELEAESVSGTINMSSTERLTQT